MFLFEVLSKSFGGVFYIFVVFGAVVGALIVIFGGKFMVIVS